MVTSFTSGPGWQCSSGPVISRKYATGDLWPHGAGSEIGGGDKDVLDIDLHPVLAIGAKANRPNNLTGVMETYNSAASLVEMNMADKVVVKNYVANILTYSGASPNTWDATFDIGAPVYVDDSAGLTPGVTLSLSPLNQADDGNPLAGYIHYHQTDYLDSGVGGPNTSSGFPVTADNSQLVETELCIMLVNDSGQARALITE